jgi:hypothetical protein
LERHHPGIDSLRLAPEIAVAGKERLRQLRDDDGRVIRDRVNARNLLLLVRAVYLDIARWAAEDPSRWGAVGRALSDQSERVLAAEADRKPQSRDGSADPATSPLASGGTSPSGRIARSGPS